jgi:two-component system sensor histidine kinase KdpD
MGRYRTMWRYLQSVTLVLAASAISIPVHYVIEPVNLVMLYLAAVVLAAAFLGRGPAILASVLSVLTFDYFLVEPRLSFTVADSQYLLTFFGLLAVGLVISNTVAQLHNQVEAVRQREAHAAALNSLSRDLTGVMNLEEMLHSVTRHIQESFQRRVVVLLPREQELYIAADSSAVATEPATAAPQTRISTPAIADPPLDKDDLAVAGRIYQQNTQGQAISGAGARWHFTALCTSLGPVGVLGLDIRPQDVWPASAAQADLLQGFANLAALAIERARLAEQASQALVLKDIERLQTALLNSISHELRTPLVSITGALSALAETSEEAAAKVAADPAEQAAMRELVETAYEEARRMNQLVGNLLDMSRLESGALRLTLEPCDVQDLFGITLERFGERNRDRIVRTSLENDLPLIEVDVALIVQVLLNLLENAAKYSPKDSPIDLICRRANGTIEIQVGDRGPGVPPDDLQRIFDKFYRSRRVRNVTGLGLGLSISKGIVEAHGGRIEANNRFGGGLWIMIYLPHTE